LIKKTRIACIFTEQAKTLDSSEFLQHLDMASMQCFAKVPVMALAIKIKSSSSRSLSIRQSWDQSPLDHPLQMGSKS
jgi:hypothetical protein